MNTNKPDLGRVVMPLVKVLRDADLSWSCREDIAEAILACWRNWDSMQQEQSKIQEFSKALSGTTIPQFTAPPIRNP